MVKFRLVLMILVTASFGMQACKKCVQCKLVTKTPQAIESGVQTYCDASKTRREAFAETYPEFYADLDTAVYNVVCTESE